MIRITSNLKSLFLAVAFAGSAGLGFAQEPPRLPDSPPKPAAKSTPVPGDEDTSQNPDRLLPDNRPLTGLQQTTVGTSPERHSYWLPGFSYNNFIQSNAQLQGGGSSWNSTSYLVGTVSLLQNWSRSQLALN